MDFLNAAAAAFFLAFAPPLPGFDFFLPPDFPPGIEKNQKSFFSCFDYPKCECQLFQIQIKKMDNKSSTSPRSPGDVEGEPVAKKSRMVHKTIIYDVMN